MVLRARSSGINGNYSSPGIQAKNDDYLQGSTTEHSIRGKWTKNALGSISKEYKFRLHFKVCRTVQIYLDICIAFS